MMVLALVARSLASRTERAPVDDELDHLSKTFFD
jgi:hypothetical protein